MAKVNHLNAIDACLRLSTFDQIHLRPARHADPDGGQNFKMTLTDDDAARSQRSLSIEGLPIPHISPLALMVYAAQSLVVPAIQAIFVANLLNLGGLQVSSSSESPTTNPHI